MYDSIFVVSATLRVGGEDMAFCSPPHGSCQLLPGATLTADTILVGSSVNTAQEGLSPLAVPTRRRAPLPDRLLGLARQYPAWSRQSDQEEGTPGDAAMVAAGLLANRHSQPMTLHEAGKAEGAEAFSSSGLFRPALTTGYSYVEEVEGSREAMCIWTGETFLPAWALLLQQ